jgi:GTP-binding protein HflX
VTARDQVFATLDPTMRELKLASGRRVILSDTVGFISDLPTTLVAAFRATLEEVIAADLVLHVRDISHPETEAQRRDVEDVLGELGLDPLSADAALLEVWNKADRLTSAQRAEVVRALGRSNRCQVLVSALTGEGIDVLRNAMDGSLGARDEVLSVEIPPSQAKLLSWLHANTDILDQETAESGVVKARFRIGPDARGKFESQLKRAGLSTSR